MTIEYIGKGTFIPLAVLENGVRTGAIPVLGTVQDGEVEWNEQGQAVDWWDNREFCRRALRDQDGAGDCSSLRKDDIGRWCSLNGPKRRSMCVFDCPDTARVWQRIRAYQAKWLQGGGEDDSDVS